MSLLAALEGAILAAARRADAASLEIEMRAAVDAAYFYRQFAACTRMPEMRSATLAYSGTRVSVATVGDTRIRTERCETGCCALSCSSKRRVSGPTDFGTSRGRLRVDVQIEAPAESRASAYERHKQRVSFRFAGAESWRVDFTRVGGSDRCFEVEIELDSARLVQCASAADARRAATEALRVLALLDIRVDR